MNVLQVNLRGVMVYRLLGQFVLSASCWWKVHIFVERSRGVGRSGETQHAEDFCWETEHVCKRYSFKCTGVLKFTLIWTPLPMQVCYGSIPVIT